MSILKGRRGELPLLAIVLVIIVIIAVVSMVVFFPWKVTNVDVTRTIEIASGMTEIDLNFDQEVGLIEVAFSEVSEDIVMTVEGTVRQNLLASGDPLEILWSHDLVGERLILNAAVEVSSFATTYGNDEIVTKLSLPSRLSAMVNISSTVGSIELSARDRVSLRGAHLSETTGSVLVQLKDVTLSGEFNMQSTTGSCILEWTDVTIFDSAQVSASCTTGGITMEVSQVNVLGGNLSLAASATTGGIDLDLTQEARWTELARVAIDDGRRAGRRWTPLEADLSAWAGRRVVLRIELQTGHPVGRRDLSWLGSPRIFTPPPAGAADPSAALP